MKIADENSRTHPSLYLSAMEECEKIHDYRQMEEIGERAAEKIVAREVGFSGDTELYDTMKFESEMIEESRRNNTSLFWNYFQHWKLYFPMEEKERKQYLRWAEKIVYSRADAIVGGQHRRHYGDVAVLLAMVADIKEGMGVKGAKTEIFAEYKKKFPRHSSFQGEMKRFFGK